MNEIFLNIVLVLFPIMMYLVFSCYNALSNYKVEKVVFVLTILTSIYLSLVFNKDDKILLIFCNIPVLICYFKKESLLGVVISLVVIIFSYYVSGINIYVTILKYFSYFVTYMILYKRKEFNYLFLKVSAVIQGFFLSLEYFMNIYYEIDRIIDLLLYIAIIYAITFFSLYLFKLASNIGDLYKTVNKVQEENKLKNSLFKLTHEIKNPIAVCKGYLDMINLDDKNKSKRYINIIKSEIDRSLNVIADFMDYSKIKINKEIFDINLLLDEIYESFSLLSRSNNIEFNYENREEEVYLFGDYERLKQVFVNIIKNSIESIEDNGIINLDEKIFPKEVVITISDNGMGMDKDTLNNVKEMFYTTKKNGTGLGVALSNEIILAHNGKMEYESTLGKGTKCIIILPR